MPDYRRAHVPGGTYFFTVNTYRRQTFRTDADVRSAWKARDERHGIRQQQAPGGVGATQFV